MSPGVPFEGPKLSGSNPKVIFRIERFVPINLSSSPLFFPELLAPLSLLSASLPVTPGSFFSAVLTLRLALEENFGTSDSLFANYCYLEDFTCTGSVVGPVRLSKETSPFKDLS